jgi:amino acid transporter
VSRRYNVNNCWPLNTAADVLAGAKACCDITGAIAPAPQGRNGAMFFIFLILIGTLFTVTLSFIAGCRFIYSFARDRGFPGSLNNIMAYVEPRTKVPLGSISLYLSLGVRGSASASACFVSRCADAPCVFSPLRLPLCAAGRTKARRWPSPP